MTEKTCQPRTMEKNWLLGSQVYIYVGVYVYNCIYIYTVFVFFCGADIQKKPRIWPLKWTTWAAFRERTGCGSLKKSLFVRRNAEIAPSGFRLSFELCTRDALTIEYKNHLHADSWMDRCLNTITKRMVWYELSVKQIWVFHVFPKSWSSPKSSKSVEDDLVLKPMSLWWLGVPHFRKHPFVIGLSFINITPLWSFLIFTNRVLNPNDKDT